MQIIPYSLLNRYISLVMANSFGCLSRKKYSHTYKHVHTHRHTHVHTHTTHRHTETHTHKETDAHRDTHTDVGHPGLMLPEVLSGTDAVSS